MKLLQRCRSITNYRGLVEAALLRVRSAKPSSREQREAPGPVRHITRKENRTMSTNVNRDELNALAQSMSDDELRVMSGLILAELKARKAKANPVPAKPKAERKAQAEGCGYKIARLNADGTVAKVLKRTCATIDEANAAIAKLATEVRGAVFAPVPFVNVTAA